LLKEKLQEILKTRLEDGNKYYKIIELYKKIIKLHVKNRRKLLPILMLILPVIPRIENLHKII
jgi:hypothetical protein